MNSMAAPFFLFLILLVGCSTQQHGPHQFFQSTSKGLKVALSYSYDDFYRPGYLPINISGGSFIREQFYFGTPKGLMSLDPKTGRQHLFFASDIPIHAAPVADQDGVVIVANQEGELFFLNNQGKQLDKVSLAAPIEAPLVIANDLLVVTFRTHGLAVISLKDRKVKWSYRQSINKTTTLHRRSWATVQDQRLYIGFSDGQLLAFNLELGQLLWEKSMLPPDGRSKQFQDVVVTPTFFGGKLWVSTDLGPLMMIDPQQGEVLRQFSWYPTSELVVEGDLLWFAHQEGKVAAINAQGELVRESPVLTPVAINRLALVRDQLVIVDVKGRIQVYSKNPWLPTFELSLGHDVSSLLCPIYFSPTLPQEIIFYSSRYRLYVIK